MDGTGMLFEPFVRLLPDSIDVRVVHYPEETYLSYAQLAQRVLEVVPLEEPYLIIAESYSGPIAVLLAAHAIGNLQAVVFVSSFVCRPLGRIGAWVAKIVPTAVFRVRPPAWILRVLLMDSATPSEMVTGAQDAIIRVKPEVLIHRLRDALNADSRAMLSNCTARMVYLLPAADRVLGVRGLRGFLAAKPDIETVKILGPHLLLQCAPAGSLAVLQKLGLLNNSTLLS
jgi:pimeloyl-ACP methyl ester carboxylesterase